MAFTAFPIAEQPISVGSFISGNGTSGTPLNVNLTPLRPALDLREFVGKYATLSALTTAITSPETNSLAYLDATTGASGGTSAAGFVFWNGSAWVAFALASAGGGASVSYDSLTSGVFTAEIARIGGTACTVASPATGEYNITIPSGADVQRLTIFANSTIVNGSNALIVRLNNAANSRNRRVQVELFSVGLLGLITQWNVFGSGTTPNISFSGNITTITIPDFGGFGSTGAWIELR